MNFSNEEGVVLLIDKPLHWTSFDVVKKVRILTKSKKVGHAGTLDPLATGLLILCTNKKTKEIDSYQAQDKEYTGTFLLGKTSPSHDLETAFDSETDPTGIDIQQLENVAKEFTGKIEQIPPNHSAVKIDGKKAYEMARKGKQPNLSPKSVEVKIFEMDASDFPTIQFKIVCSKGTYIRSLVRDLGAKLNCGATLTGLRRTKIGNYDVANAMTIEQITKTVHENLP